MMARAFEGALNVLRTCAQVKPHEKILIVTDTDTDVTIANSLMAAATELGAEVCTVVMRPRVLPGQEPPAPVVAAMLSSDLIICPTSRTLFHTNARADACRRGARFISMAGATISVLSSPAMLANFDEQELVVKRVAALLTHADHVTLTNPAGTNIQFDVAGRRGLGITAKCRQHGDATGVPDIEAYIAPLEHETNGTLIIDGSTSVTGLVQRPIRIKIEHGKALSITGGPEARRLLRVVREARSRAASRVGELGIGLNPLARLRGAIIEDEGMLGTAHVALGDNHRFGGRNKAPIHIDMVLRNPQIEFDGRTILKGKRLML